MYQNAAQQTQEILQNIEPIIQQMEQEEPQYIQ
ncbi:hypothetical protein D8M04_13725 [Oceanobacillus piezotolerans]|uniref:DUF1657 domain-containing protein n=1 Tax=Oceanobacillus piezotolerans TaxID=2448030 RepID=A0A498D9Y0_9BACI|nr:hypothetical protein D8M04_13725 [Oceanobacillus piezotolerans]